MSHPNRELLQTISDVLLRCWIAGFVLLCVGFGGSQFFHGFVTDLHSKMFGLSPHELDIIFYCALGFIKLMVLVCFFIPWLSLKLVLRKQVS